jgi:hypothetical protein
MSEVEKFASNIKNLEKIALLEESEHTGGEITPEEIRGRLNGGNVVLKPTNRGWSLTQMIQVMMLIQEIVFDMCWAFLLAPDGDPGFLTSDNPVALFDAPGLDVPGMGFLSSPDTYLTFPVCRNVSLRAKHRP